MLAELALRRMCGKREILAHALTGRFTDHHAFLVRAMLDRIDACTAMETRLSERIDAQVRPFRRRIELLTTIPGMNIRAAEVVLAEIGADIARFPSAADLWLRRNSHLPSSAGTSLRQTLPQPVTNRWIQAQTSRGGIFKY
ncbi:transposase [Saccharothrix sp. ST-888]|uniref:transposase n=1 Tax=Saccharothrix sp. ST-888 TaxID=1427391 RepID=UPI0005EC21C5|nr:transposase [Saccharothrix sp. ST-888]KJK57580.1 hypothetical protein UK12_15635 [Saccharothrix sp. ST-888]